MEDREKKKISIVIGIGAILIAVVFLSLVVEPLMYLMPKKEEMKEAPQVTLNDYLTIRMSGYDGFGEATVEIDEAAFIRDNKDIIQTTNALEKSMKKNGLYQSGLPFDIAEHEEEAAIRYFIEMVLEENALVGNNELSNGDALVLSWSEDLRGSKKESLEELFGVSIVANDMTIRVEGLKTPPTFDPFEGYTITLKGINGYADAKSDYGFDKAIYYEMSSYYNLSNGDEVTVMATYSIDEMSDKDFLRTYGKLPSVKEKKYTIQNLPALLESMTDVQPNELDKMHEKAEECIIYDLLKYEGSYVADIQYDGYYFGSNDSRNILTLIYEIDFTQEIVDYLGDERTFETTYYYFLQWNDVGICPDGTLSCDMDEFSHSTSKLDILSDVDGNQYIYSSFHGNKTWEAAREEAKSKANRYLEMDIEENQFIQ